MKQKELLKEILDAHQLWLESNGKKGMRAKLRYADLEHAGLKGANLQHAYLQYANLQYANLKDANLMYADLEDANLEGAKLRGANLKNAYIFGASLKDADLKGANLEGADLIDADLRGANLVGANLSGAELSGADLENALLPSSLDNLPEGELIGYKKVGGCIVKLKILTDSKRSRATSDKCRCDKALVLAIENLDGTDSEWKRIVNPRFAITAYEVGKIVYADSWDEDRWTECSHGIHFFLDRKMAVDW